MSMGFGERVRAYRLRAGKTQAELARDLGLRGEGYVSKLETERKSPSIQLIMRLADVLEVSTDMLLRDRGVKSLDKRQGDVGASAIHGPEHEYTRRSNPNIKRIPRVLPQLFGDKLRVLRQQRRLTQAAMAMKLGMTSTGYISSLEASKKAPSLTVVLRVADVFEVTTDYLLRDEVPVDSSNDTLLGSRS